MNKDYHADILRMCQQGLSDPDGTALAGAMRACAALEDVEMLAKLIPKLKELKFLLKGDILFACDLIPQIGTHAYRCIQFT